MIGELHITPEAVVNTITQLDSFSAMGPDELHPYFLKKCKEQLYYPLMVIFQRSYLISPLPEMWKSSSEVPIFKKGSRADPLIL